MKTMNTLKLINRALLAGIVTLTLVLAVCVPASAQISPNADKTSGHSVALKDGHEGHG